MPTEVGAVAAVVGTRAARAVAKEQEEQQGLDQRQCCLRRLGEHAQQVSLHEGVDSARLIPAGARLP